MEGKAAKVSAVLIAIFLLFYFSPNKEQVVFPEWNKLQEEVSSALRIERLGITAPLLFSESRKEDDFQVLLRSGVVHMARTAFPGQVGNAYIVGHSSDYKHVPGEYKRVFESLPQIKTGDLIQVNYEGREYVYKVFETKIVSPNDTWVMSQETQGRKLLSLQTSYPIGTAKQRFIVVAEQIEK